MKAAKLAVGSVCIAGIIALLSACDSSDGGSGQNIEGTLVTPSDDDPAVVDCPSVPEGYNPIANAVVQFTDSDGNVVESAEIVTDNCGNFVAAVPAGADNITAESEGNETLIASVSAVSQSDGVASTIPAGAAYRIGFLDLFDNGEVGFTVIDDVTNKAVVGLSPESFTLLADGETVTFTSIRTGIVNDSASIVLATDFSGSMSRLAFEENGIEYARINVAAIAAHMLLDQKSPEDEIAMLVFDNIFQFLDRNSVNELFPIQDINGNLVEIDYPESGFTTNSADLRFAVDAYNKDSKLWDEDNQFATHPDTPNVIMANRYPGRGGTAFYDAAVEASDRLVARTNPRRIVIAMSDGMDNASDNDLEDVIAKANVNGTPVYTIGFETEEEELTRIATETGATHINADSLNLDDTYNSILTNIRYQNTGITSRSVEGAMKLELQFDINQDGVPEATRTIVP